MIFEPGSIHSPGIRVMELIYESIVGNKMRSNAITHARYEWYQSYEWKMVDVDLLLQVV